MTPNRNTMERGCVAFAGAYTGYKAVTNFGAAKSSWNGNTTKTEKLTATVKALGQATIAGVAFYASINRKQAQDLPKAVLPIFNFWKPLYFEGLFLDK